MIDWFPSQGHYCYKCLKKIKCPKCGSLKVTNQGYDVYLCRECSNRFQHIPVDGGYCRII